MTREEEQNLLKKAQAGDQSAFEQLVLEHEKTVYRLALRQLGNPQDAEDAAQEVFLKAYTGLKSFRGESKVSVWLYRITCNVCTDALRKRKDTVSLSVDSEGEETELDVPDTRYDPVQIAERCEVREQVAAALKQLPEDARRILLLREIGGQSYDEIAETLALDMGTVKSRIFRARKKLCVLLAGNFHDGTPSKNTKEGAQQ